MMQYEKPELKAILTARSEVMTASDVAATEGIGGNEQEDLGDL